MPGVGKAEMVGGPFVITMRKVGHANVIIAVRRLFRRRIIMIERRRGGPSDEITVVGSEVQCKGERGMNGLLPP
jgi:hypothetical protein